MAAGVSTPAQHQAQCGASVRPLAYSTTAAYLTIYYSPFTIHFSLQAQNEFAGCILVPE